MNSQKEIFLKTKDYSVSNEAFDLRYNQAYDMLETSPQPELALLDSYYESEDYISHTDAKRSMTDRIYQFVKKFTIAKKVKRINTFNLDGKTLLDIGCGTGDFLHACKRSGWTVTGVEPNQRARELAMDKLRSHGFNNLYSDLGAIQEKESFDVITLWHVLEHVPNLKTYIQEIKKLLNPSGVLIVAVPNYKSFDAKHYKKYWAAYDVPRHLWHFSKISIKQLFEKEGIRLVKIAPMIFDSFYVSLLSEKYKSGKSNVIKAFFVGLISNLKGWSSKEYSSHIYILKTAE